MLLKYEMCKNRDKSYMMSYGELDKVPSNFLIEIDKEQYDYYKDKDKCYINRDRIKRGQPFRFWKGSMGSIIQLIGDYKHLIDISRIYLDKSEIIKETILNYEN